MSYFNRNAWHYRALRALTQLTIEKPYLTADELHEAIEDPTEPNQVGAVFQDASAQGLIIDTGRMVLTRREPGKGRKITLWRSAYAASPADHLIDHVKAYQEQLNVPAQESML